jgi:hypothetical protein
VLLLLVLWFRCVAAATCCCCRGKECLPEAALSVVAEWPRDVLLMSPLHRLLLLPLQGRSACPALAQVLLLLPLLPASLLLHLSLGAEADRGLTAA